MKAVCAIRHKFLYELMKDVVALTAAEGGMKIAECEELQKKLMTILKEKRKANADKTLAEKKVLGFCGRGRRIPQTLECLFSFVSTPNLATTASFCGIFRDLYD